MLMIALEIGVVVLGRESGEINFLQYRLKMLGVDDRQ